MSAFQYYVLVFILLPLLLIVGIVLLVHRAVRVSRTAEPHLNQGKALISSRRHLAGIIALIFLLSLFLAGIIASIF